MPLVFPYCFTKKRVIAKFALWADLPTNKVNKNNIMFLSANIIDKYVAVVTAVCKLPVIVICNRLLLRQLFDMEQMKHNS